MARRVTPLSILLGPLVLLLVIGCDGSSQHSRDTADLEKRVTALDQRVKQLEAELAALRGAAGPATAAAAAPASATPTGAEPAEPPSPAPAPADNAGVDAGRGAQPVAPTTTTAIEVVANPQLKGSMGRIVVEFPKEAKTDGTRVEINKAGEKKASVGNYGKTVAELLPGQYELVISGARVGGAEVKSRHDTRIPVGVLRISTSGKDTAVTVLSADGAKQLDSGYGSRDVGLPAGKYMVKVSGQTAPVEIKAGQVTDF